MNIELMKAKVLDLAIRGRLTEQSPDEALRPEVLQLPEVKGPFELPENWRWVTLNAVGRIVGGGTPKAEDKFWEPGEIAWLRPADFSKVKGKYITCGERFISQEGLKKSSAQLMPAGAVVFSSRAPIGYVFIAANSVATSQGCKSVVPDEDKVTSDWLYYSLIYAVPEIKSRAAGTTFLEISGKKFGETKIALPPLNEQRRIVQKIEELFKIIDALQEHQDSLLDKLDLIRRTALDKAIRGQLTEQHADESLSPEVLKLPDVKGLFELPDNWRWVSLSNAGVWKSGGTPSRKEPSFYKNGTIHWFKTGELCDGYLTNSEEKNHQVGG